MKAREIADILVAYFMANGATISAVDIHVDWGIGNIVRVETTMNHWVLVEASLGHLNVTTDTLPSSRTWKASPRWRSQAICKMLTK